MQVIVGNAIISISAVIRHSTAFKVKMYKSNGLQNVNIWTDQKEDIIIKI